MLYGMLRWMPQGVIRRGRIASHCDADLACGHPNALHSSHISAVASLRTAAQTWGADILALCIASSFAMRLLKWHPQGIIRRSRLASHCGTDLSYGRPGARRSIHIRSGLAIRYPDMAPKTDRPPPSPRCALRHRWRTDILVLFTRSTSATGLPYGMKKTPARDHPPRSLRFALRSRPGVRTSGCPAHHPHSQWVCPTVRHGSPRGIIRRGRLASHCDADLAYGHPGALHSI